MKCRFNYLIKNIPTSIKKMPHFIWWSYFILFYFYIRIHKTYSHRRWENIYLRFYLTLLVSIWALSWFKRKLWYNNFFIFTIYIYIYIYIYKVWVCAWEHVDDLSMNQQENINFYWFQNKRWFLSFSFISQWCFRIFMIKAKVNQLYQKFI